MKVDPSSVGRYRPDPFQIEQPLPLGMDIPAEIQRPAPQSIQNNIRGLIQRLRGQTPTPADTPPPPAPPPQPMRSVLKRP
jgi:hypothetical protein